MASPGCTRKTADLIGLSMRIWTELCRVDGLLGWDGPEEVDRRWEGTSVLPMTLGACKSCICEEGGIDDQRRIMMIMS